MTIKKNLCLLPWAGIIRNRLFSAQSVKNLFDIKQVLNNVTENTYEHLSIRMSTKVTYESVNNSHVQASSKIIGTQ